VGDEAADVVFEEPPLALDAIFYAVRGGIAWRQLPAEFPPAITVYAIFVRWFRAGVWQRIHDALRDRVGAGRRHGGTVEPRLRRGKKINGRKRHIAVDTNGLLWRSW
jgi:transposase